MNEQKELVEDTEQQPGANRASFLATFPANQSAISMHGSGGMRIQLEIPENDLPNALALTLWRDRVMRVVITPLAKDPKQGWRE